MKRILHFLLLIVLPLVAISQPNASVKNLKVSQKSRQLGQVVIGSSSFDGSAILTLTSTTQGALMPRMNTAARDAISSPTDGLLIFNTQTNQYEFFQVTWQAIGGGGDGNIYDNNGFLAADRTLTMGGNDLTFSSSSGDRFKFGAELEYTNIPGGFPVSTNFMMFQRVGIGFIKGPDGGGGLEWSIRDGDNSNALMNFFDNRVTITDGFLEFSVPNVALTGLNTASSKIFGNQNLIIKVGASGSARFRSGDNTTDLTSIDDATGNFSIGTGGVAGTARLHTKGVNAASTSDAFRAESNTGTLLMVIENAGDVGIGEPDPTSKLDVSGDVEINSSNAFYLGDPTTDGTWRIIRSGDDLLMQQREAGVYNTKQTISGA